MVTSLMLLALSQVQDDEAKAKLQKLQSTVRKPGVQDEEVEKALQDLATVKHPLILKELLSWTRKPHPALRKSRTKLHLTAADCIARQYEGDADAAKGLLEAIKALDAGRPKKREEEQDLTIDLVSLVDYFGQVRCRKVAKGLAPYFRHRYGKVAQAALRAAAQLRSRDLIEPLIQVLAEAEAMKEEDCHDPLDLGLKAANDRDRKDLLRDGAREALEETTSTKQDDSRAWKKWWEANKRSFKDLD